MEKKIKTATGKEFEILWDGVASIDGALRFAVINAPMAEIFETFSDPAECTTLTRIWDGVESVYTGYTRFRGVDRKIDGEIVVAIDPEV